MLAVAVSAQRHRWSIRPETQFLVMRDLVTPGDNRYAMSPGVYKDFGQPNFIQGENSRLKHFPKWDINEENGVLVFRDTSTNQDFRYAFYPGSGQINFGKPTPALFNNVQVLWQGIRWNIQDERGILVFRDTKSAGDNRYAFFPGSSLNL